MKPFLKAIFAATALIAVTPTSALAHGTGGDPILLGATISLTGKYATSGEDVKHGYELAIKTINELGGIPVGDEEIYRLDLKYYDDESSPATSAKIAEQLIQEDRVRFFLGPYSSEMTQAVANVTEKYKMPMIEANGVSRSLFTNNYKYLFGVSSISEQYLSSALDLAAQKTDHLGKKVSDLTVAMAFARDSFSQDVRAGVLDDIKRLGMKVVIDDQLHTDLDDMSATLAKVMTVKPDILLVSGHDSGAMTAIRQIGEMKINVPIIAMTHCNSAAIIKQFGTSAEHILCASQWARSLPFKDWIFGRAAEFAELFEQTYGYAPTYQAAGSAAAVLVLAEAIEFYSGLNPEGVRRTLAKTEMQTFFGDIKFDQTGKNIAKPMVLYQIQNGELKIVAPKDLADSDAIIPRKPGTPDTARISL